MDNLFTPTPTTPYPLLGQEGTTSVIPASYVIPATPLFAKGGAKAGIQGYMLLAMPLIGACLSLLLSIAPALAATGATGNNPGVSPAGQDVLKFLGDTAYRSGLTNSPDPNADQTDVYDIVAAVINTVLGLTGIIFFIMVFWAGFRWMTAGGAEETITTAKKTIVSSVIGIVIALSAFVITNFVLNKIEEINSGKVGAPASESRPEAITGKCNLNVVPGVTVNLGCQDATKEDCDSWGAAWTEGSCASP